MSYFIWDVLVPISVMGHFAMTLPNSSRYSYVPTTSSLSFISLLVTLSRLSVCSARGKKKVDFLHFLAARSGLMS